MRRRKRFQSTRKAAERVLNIMDRISGKSGRSGGRDDRKAGRDRASGSGERSARGVRYMTIRGNEALFNKLCRDDFHYLMSQRIDAPADVLEVLLPQSVVGRAQNGHGFFTNQYGEPLAFREASFDRVLSQLEETMPQLRHDAVRARRSLLVETVRDHVLAHVHDKTMPLETRDGPLLGAGLLAGRTVVTADFLRGMALAGFMDDIEYRDLARKLHPADYAGDRYDLGGGEIRVVNRGLFNAAGIEDPGRVAWDDLDLEQMQRLKILMPMDEQVWEYPHYDQVYFRRRLGEGVCDDLALIGIGIRHGLDAMLGAFVMDGLDTYDKFLSRFTAKGSDTRLAEAIQAAWLERHGRHLVPDEDLLGLIWFAAKNNHPRTQLSSSHRRFLQTEAGAGEPTVLHHWRFIEGKKLGAIKLGFARVTADEFYRTAHQRCRSAGYQIGKPDIGDRDDI